MKRKIISLLLSAAIISGIMTSCQPNNSKPTEQTSSVEPAKLVESVDGLAEDFIKGMDISSIIAQEQSGVVYYNEDGQVQDIFRILADAGVNYIRVRVWNDPYDSDGHGYGGGSCDADKAAEIGRRAAAYGMKLLVDFHYSDFWADPTRQLVPKDWECMTIEEKQSALYDFTVDSLENILSAGADVGIVQIGNETNNGMAGETDNENVMALLKSGISAVRDTSKKHSRQIKTAVHYTDVNDYDKMMYYAENLAEHDVDYDIFGVSYYPFWHGSMETLTTVLSNISKKSGKQTVVLETSYPYTTEDGDGFANSISDAEPAKGYPATVQGQASCIRDVIAAASEADAIGVFYWEGAWIPVGSNSADNSALWEQYGSGWASSYSAGYDPDNAGRYFGGSSWDNQAFFDFSGHPLESLNVFKAVSDTNS